MTVIAALVAAVVLPLSVFTGGMVESGFTAGINNSNNTIGTGTSFLTAKDTSSGTTDCTSVPSGSAIPATSSFSCNGSILPATLSATSGSSSTSLTSSGTTNFSGASFQAASCAPESFNNTINANNDLLVRGGVTYHAAGPFGTGSYAAGFNGVDADGVGTQYSGAGPQKFSIVVAFKTSQKSGDIVGWSTSSSNVVPTQWDRMLYIDPTGYLVFGTYGNGAIDKVSTTTNVADGNWHMVVATAQSTGTSSSAITMYLDGVKVGATTISSANPAEASTGYWRVGNDNESNGGWSTATNNYFNGSIAGFALTSNIITSATPYQYTKFASDAAYANYVTANNTLTQFWPLTDDGTNVYTGTLQESSTLNAANPCTSAKVTVGYTGACLYPSSGSTCPALSTTYTLATLGTAGKLPFSTFSPNETLTVTTGKGTYDANYYPGIHLLVPVTISTTGWAQSFTWARNETII